MPVVWLGVMPLFCSVWSIALRICVSTELGSLLNCDDVVFCSTPDTADSICWRSVDTAVLPLLAAVLSLVDDDAPAAAPVSAAAGEEPPGPDSAKRASRSSELVSLLLVVWLALLD